MPIISFSYSVSNGFEDRNFDVWSVIPILKLELQYSNAIDCKEFDQKPSWVFI